MFTCKPYYFSNDTIEIFLYIPTTNDSVTLDINICNYNNNIVFNEKGFFNCVLNKNSVDMFNNYPYTHICKLILPPLTSNVYYINCNNKKYPITILAKEQKDIIVVYPINTIAAYNKAGGKNLYHSFYEKDKANSHNNRAYKVTYKRPIEPEHQMFLFEGEFIKWVQGENLNLKYITDHQLDDINNFYNCKLLIIIGHNEYITRKAVENIETFIESGNNLLVLSGNTFWWQVRYENNMNTLVCYKNSNLDPIENNLLKTINLPNIMNIYSVIGLDFRLGGYGRDALKTYDEYCCIKYLSNNGKLLDTKIDYSEIIKKKTDKKIIPGFGGIKIIEENILFKNIVKKNDILEISSAESDGFKIDSFINNKLIYNTSDFYRYKVLGYDLMWRAGLTIAGFIACQKTENSGIVINTGTTDWCSSEGMNGPSSKEIKQITKNMINILIQDKSIISNKIFV